MSNKTCTGITFSQLCRNCIAKLEDGCDHIDFDNEVEQIKQAVNISHLCDIVRDMDVNEHLDGIFADYYASWK